MFQLLKNPNFDFMGRRTPVLYFSAVLVLLSLGCIAFMGLNLGIEFSGGTEMQVKYGEAPDLPSIRSALSRVGLDNHTVTTIGDPQEHEVYIRLGVSEGGESEREDQDELTARVVRTLIGADDDSRIGSDLNIIDESAIQTMLEALSTLTLEGRERLAAAILEQRRDGTIFRSVDDLATIPGMTPDVVEHLRDNATVGPLAVRSQSYIGPAIGRELMNKAMLAILGSLIGMLLYIWVRFQLQWGFAAVVALAHDTIVTLGLFTLFGKEMSLPVIAAFLTLVGYSVNDTVVVFDRIRENLKNRPGQDLARVVNLSINQTLSRTIITSGLTWVVVFGLLLFGGAALNPFAFVLSAGVVVGTYSSIFIASPILILWKRMIDRRKSGPRGTATARPARTKKVRTASAG